MDSNIIRDICYYLTAHINEEISIDDLAQEFNYNKFYIIRQFKKYTGFTINEFINECRVYNSTNPLIFTDDTILKIALTNGFNSLEYYSEKFKDIIGVSPLKFRQIYSKLTYILETSNDVTELEEIKSQLDTIQEYQNYLANIGETTVKEQVKVKKIA